MSTNETATENGNDSPLEAPAEAPPVETPKPEPDNTVAVAVALPSFEEAKARVNETRDSLEKFRPKKNVWMKEYLMERPLYKVDGKPSKNLYSRFTFGALGGAIGGAISWVFERNDNILGRMVIGGILVLFLMVIASTYSGVHAPEKQSIRRFLARVLLNDQVKPLDDRSLQTKQYLSTVKLYEDLVNKTRTRLESEGVFEAINLGVDNEALPGESFSVSLDEDGRFVYCPTGLDDEEYSLNNDNVKLREEMLVHLRTLSPRTLS